MTLDPAARAADAASRAAPAAGEALPSADASSAAAASDSAGSSAAAAALGSSQQAWAASGHFAETLPNAQEWLAQHGEVHTPPGFASLALSLLTLAVLSALICNVYAPERLYFFSLGY